MSIAEPCPCGAPLRYDECCGRLHRGAAEAETAEELMRSRYAAFAKDELDYLWRTWHPRTRPEDLEPDPGLTWTGLRILDVVDGQAGDERGVVEFAATYTRAGRPGERRERSEFVRRRGRWVYESGEVD